MKLSRSKFGLAWLLCLATVFLCTQRVLGAGVNYAMQLEKSAESLLLDIARAGERLVAVGERGHILYSEDEGMTWIQVQVPTDVMLTRLFFIDDLQGWAVGHDGNVLHSRDGGVSWVLQRDGVASQSAINEQRAGRALSEFEALRAQLAVASDTDASALEAALDDAQWMLDSARTVLDEPLYAPPLMDVWFSSPERGWAAGAYGVLLHTANGGRDWTDWSHKVDNPEELHLNGVVGDGQGGLYLASEWGIVFVSANEGEAWHPVESGYEGSFFGLLHNLKSGSLFAYGLLGTIYRSADQGKNWEQLDSGVSASLFGAHAGDDTLVFVGQSGTATYTQDDGGNFSAEVQARRDGLFGVAPLGDGEFIATGEGGSRKLETVPGSKTP